jgi:hypothetical protein
MNPRLRLTRRFVIGCATALVAFVVACAFFRIRSPHDFVAYLGMAGECHPVWKQFAFRRFGRGDSADEFLRRYPPTHREEFGRYGVYQYYPNTGDLIWFTGLTVVTRDGRLLGSRAWSCTWQFTFFHTADPALDSQYAAYVEERREKLSATTSD